MSDEGQDVQIDKCNHLIISTLPPSTLFIRQTNKDLQTNKNLHPPSFIRNRSSARSGLTRPVAEDMLGLIKRSRRDT